MSENLSVLSVLKLMKEATAPREASDLEGR